MRAWVIRATGSLDRIELTDLPPAAATPGPGDVRVGIRAAALNHLDLHVVQGLPLEYRFPHIFGADGAGVAEAVRRDVACLAPAAASLATRAWPNSASDPACPAS